MPRPDIPSNYIYCSILLSGRRAHFSGLSTLLFLLCFITQVMCFNGKGEWVQAREPLHVDIDLRKQHRCGVGPALVCARALLNLRKGSSSNDRAIGLVPCAIGGASLDEWQKNYSGEVGDCEGSTEAPVGTPVRASSPWSYNPGAHNLFGAMAERAEDALRDAPPGSELVGVLWFQGETDAITRDTAETYFDRFETLVQDIRGLGHPHLKIFTVAVTGATTRLPHLTAVRNAQLKAGLPGGIDGVWVTDALGLPMYPDGLHLTTEAQVKLGEAIALQVFTSSHSLEAIKAATSNREGADP